MTQYSYIDKGSHQKYPFFEVGSLYELLQKTYFQKGEQISNWLASSGPVANFRFLNQGSLPKGTILMFLGIQRGNEKKGWAEERNSYNFLGQQDGVIYGLPEGTETLNGIIKPEAYFKKIL